jgi:SAM-dependent methyltransferase
MNPVDGLEVYADADFYDQEFEGRVHEIPFYLARARACAGPVLEVACGTGRLTIPLAQAGIPIAGLDVSPAMIDRAREKSAALRLDIDWRLQDARRMDLGRRFAMIFMATNALQHLEDLDSLLSFLERARGHLEPKGTLIFDVFNPSPEKLARGLGSPRPHKTFTLQDGRRVDVTVDGEYLRDRQILHFILTYRHAGEILARKDIRQRCFFPEELIALCRLGGFDVLERMGNYDGRAFDTASPKQILVCRPRLNAATGAPGTAAR